ncbi:MAG TPA: hypothetical protein VGN31_15570, partial [Paraburkholderia sp.]
MPVAANDTRNAQMIAEATTRNLTGYPADVSRFEQRQAGMLDQLASLPAAESRFYAASAATFNSAYRIATQDGRAELLEQFGQFEDAVRGESNRAANDPLERVIGVFNSPVGAGYLDKTAQSRVSLLSQMRRRFIAAATPEQRERVFKSALALKKNLQSQISDAIKANDTKQAADWKEANADVDRMIGEADRLKDDPGKRYELIARQLHTSNPGSGEDPFEERRILAFTQRMRDDPALREKLDIWQVEAGKKLNSYGVGGPKRYTDIANSLPAAGPEYVRDLADRYDALLGDATQKNRSITPQERAKKLAGQILEGTARTLLGMTPFAPLTMVLDKHSSLSPTARIGIDLTAGLLGMALDPASAALSETKFFTQAIKEIDTLADLGRGAGAVSGTTSAERPLASALPQYVGLQEKISGHPPTVPAGCAANAPLDSLKASAGAPAMLTDENGQNFVAIDGRAYPARYDKNTATAQVYDANNPWKPTYPLRLNSNSEWIVSDAGPLRLRGGGGGVDVAEAGASASPPISPELKTALEAKTWQSPANAYLDDPAYRQTYQAAFDRLTDDQQRAIKRWTELDESSAIDSGSSGLNFDLNED